MPKPEPPKAAPIVPQVKDVSGREPSASATTPFARLFSVRVDLYLILEPEGPFRIPGGEQLFGHPPHKRPADMLATLFPGNPSEQAQTLDQILNHLTALSDQVKALTEQVESMKSK
jgi:hypothetical protein